MSTTDNQTTLDMVLSRLGGLEQRNIAIEAENVRMREELARLRAERPALQAAREHPEPGLNGNGGRSSRRLLLQRAAGAAVATVAAGAMLKRETDSASANHGGTGISSVEGVDCHYVVARQPTDSMAVAAVTTSANYAAVQGINDGTGPGIYGASNNATGPGVYGTGLIGVKGEGPNGVVGESFSADYAATYGNHKGAGYGVVGDTTSGSTTSGVLGRHRGAGPGVKGESVYNNGYGVHGKGSVGVYGEGPNGVWVVSSSPDSTAVYGQHTGAGPAVTGGNNTGTWASVLGRNSGTGPGVHGRSTGSTGDGVLGDGKNGMHGRSATFGGNGVWGESTGNGFGIRGTSTQGYGGLFQGAKAQLRLVPGTTTGAPKTLPHAKGELYMDFAATLWVCTVSGTPGAWKKLLLG